MLARCPAYVDDIVHQRIGEPDLGDRVARLREHGGVSDRLEGKVLEPGHGGAVPMAPNDLALDGASFDTVAGAVLEIVRPRGAGPAWLVRWASRALPAW